MKRALSPEELEARLGGRTNGGAPDPGRRDVGTYAFTAATPAEHFLTDYIAYAAGRTDAPHEYHEAVGLTLLAAALAGVKVRLRQYPHGLGANLYTLLVGPSTGWRKSTSKDTGQELHDAVIPHGALADLASPEGFLEQMAQRAGQPATWFIDEMGELLDKLHHAKFMAGLRGALLQLYDGRDYHYRRHSKRDKDGARQADADEIREPHLCLLGCCTPAVFDRLSTDDLTGGFLMRFAIIMPTRKPPRRGFEEAPPDLLTQRTALTRRLHDLYQWAQAGPPAVVLAPAALRHLDDFSALMEQAAETLPEAQRAMLRRLDAMVLKLGLLVAAGHADTPQRSTLTITLPDAEAAGQIAERFRRDALAFATRIGENEIDKHAGRARAFLARQAAGPVPRRDVARHLHLAKRLVDDVEATMEDRGVIVVHRGERAWELTKEGRDDA